MKATIVIDLGYGDSGKGIATDYLCDQAKNPVVVRFSGGQQAGHTVVRNGKKHTFSNFGSGTFQDVPTYFTEHTTVYPSAIAREQDRLADLGVEPLLVIHPLARLTTPYDVMHNRTCTDNKAHGTCGMGVGKTHHRHNTSGYRLYAVDLLCPEILRQKMERIRDEYYEAEFGGDLELDLMLELEEEERIFMQAVKGLKWIIKGYEFLECFHTLVFEGSQGVMLDKDHGVFPHVTYSNTTSKVPMEICDKLNILDRQVYHVTRAYSTKHGSGPYNSSGRLITLQNNDKEHNVTNKFQGEFLTSPMDYEILNQAIRVDESYTKGYMTNLIVTCNDQIVFPENDFDINQVNKNYYEVMYSYSAETMELVVAKKAVFKQRVNAEI